METLTQAKLKEVLDYDAETGRFTRISFSGNYAGGSATLGPVISKPDERGYLRIRVGGKKYRAHRLAWLFVYGAFPRQGIDHINGDKLDNRIGNLREANQSENSQNRVARRGTEVGVLGVSVYRKTGKFHAQIRALGKNMHIGYYDTVEDAHAAYCRAKQTLHVFNPIPR